MPYQVLARKWRPHDFKDMVGQEPILRMLIHALTDQRLHHAYLFTGTRGVGKTTVARIFAKCLNCEKGISPTPCNECSTCLAIDSGRFVDLLEIDAASRTKVEDTRELLDNVQYSPTQGRFKIYLIDEVHMLSSHSFNALLKTLEEPPAHVKFLLATTDPKRLPITILSRCLQFNLRHVSQEQIAKHLETICIAENITFESNALLLIADAADGSVRDALSLMDQAITYCANKITETETREMLGYVEQTPIIHLLTALAEQNAQKLYAGIQDLIQQAPDFNQALSELLSTLHKITLAQVVPELNTHLEPIKQLAKQLTPEDVQLYYQIALIGKRDLPYMPHPALGFEMILLRMLAFKPISEVAKITEPLKKKEETKEIKVTGWSELLPKLELKGVALALASNCSQTSFQNHKMELALAPQHSALFNDKVLERIQEALTKYFNQAIKLEIKIANETLQTPAKEQFEKMTAKQTHATSAIKEDEHVKAIMDVFGATLDPNSIKAV